MTDQPIMRPYIHADHTDEEDARAHEVVRRILGGMNFPTYDEMKQRLDRHRKPA